VLFLLNVVLNWGIPFVILLFRSAKRTPWVLLAVAASVLLGRWLDLYLMILRPMAGATPLPGVWGVGLFFGVAGLSVLLIGRALSRAALIPVKDPFLAGSVSPEK
jgi:hypothetical protein